YLNAEENDPAERRAWKIRLGTMLKTLEEEHADAPGDERKALQRAIERIQEELGDHAGFLPERGWLGFATPDKLEYTTFTPAPMPDLARLEGGAHVAPYIRALKQARPVTAIVPDRRHARVLRYLHGELQGEDSLWSDAALADVPSRGSTKQATTRSGVRGEAG